MHSSMRYLSKLKLHKKIIIIESTMSELSIWVYWTCNHICELDIDAHNDHASSNLNPLSYPQQKCTQAIWPRRQFFKRNDEKCIDRRSNNATTGQKIMNELWNSNINCIPTAPFWWTTKRLFNSNTAIFSRSWVKIINSYLRRLNKLIYFKRV